MVGSSWILSILLLGQAPAPSELSKCLNNASSCNVSRLAPAERTQLSSAIRTRNFERCKDGSQNCDPLLLDKSQVPIIQSLVYERNLAKCLESSPACNPLMLTAPHQADVHRARLKKNFDSCLDAVRNASGEPTESRVATERDNREADGTRAYVTRA